MLIQSLERHEVPLYDFCTFIGLQRDLLGGLVGVSVIPLEGHQAPVWLVEYSLDDFSGLDQLRSQIPIPGIIDRSAPARQATFVFGRIAARAGIFAQTGKREPVPFGPQGAPLWPKGLTGSISHTGTHAAAWVERYKDAHIGLDLQLIMSDREAQELSSLIMSAHEAKLLEDVFGRHEWSEGVTLLFSAKEATYKALSPLIGRFMDFDEVEVEWIDMPMLSLSLRLLKTPGDRADLPERVQIGFAAVGPSILTFAVATTQRSSCDALP